MHQPAPPAELLLTETILRSIHRTYCRRCPLPVVADKHGDYICDAGHRGNVWGDRGDYELDTGPDPVGHERP